MKKFLWILLAALMLMLTACGTSESADEPTNLSPPPDSSTLGASSSSDDSQGGADVDLTGLSSTMIYSEIYNILYVESESYLGKTIRLSGLFTFNQMVDETGLPTGEPFGFACLIPDATACCAAGVEFELAGDPVFPDDYPEYGADITVTGRFVSYQADGFTQYRLVDARLES